jgi:PAS domain S-box-containing protein
MAMKQLNFDTHFQDLFDHSSDLIQFLDMNGLIITANPSWLKTLGYRLEEVRGHSIYDYIMPAYREHYMQYRTEVVRKRQPGDISFSLLSKTGEEVVVEGQVGCVYQDGEPVYTRGVFRNNTQERAATIALAKNERWLATIIRGAPSAVVIINEKQTVLEWNPKAEAIFGFPAAEVIGRPLADVIIPENYREAHARGMAHFLATGEGPVLNKTIEITALHQEGHSFPVNLSISNVKTETGWIFIAFIADITSYKQLQEEVIRREAQLLQSRLMNEKQDEFLSMASHELKTPLTSLKAYLQLMENIDGENGKLSPAVFLPKALTSAAKLEKLIADLLDVSKIKANRMEYSLEAFDIGELLQECVEDLQQTFESHRLHIVETLQQQCIADRLRVEQVIVNLLTNAVKYSPDADEVQVGVRLQQNEVMVYVKDFGIGISAENQKYLFQRFYRVDSAAGRFQGLGIGLFLSKEIIERHRGRIWAESNEEEGSCFYFTLPLPQVGSDGEGNNHVL